MYCYQLLIDTNQKVLARNFMFLDEFLPGTGGEADDFVPACLYLSKTTGTAMLTPQKIILD